MTPLSGQPFNAKVGVLTELSGECVHFSEQGLGYLHSKGKMHRDIKVIILFICSFLALISCSPVVRTVLSSAHVFVPVRFSAGPEVAPEVFTPLEVRAGVTGKRRRKCLLSEFVR